MDKEATISAGLNAQVAPIVGEVCYRKQRRERRKLLLIELFFDFAKNTTLHGLRYVAERGLSIIERLFWFVTFVASATLCLMLIYKVWNKWDHSPVIVSFSENLQHVSKVPFPSVTICPQLKCKQSAYNFSGQFPTKESMATNNFTQEELDTFEDIATVCDEFGMVEFVSLGNKQITNKTCLENIIQVAPTIDEAFTWCTTRGVDIACSKIFKRVLTSEGVCYNYNSLASSEIFKESNLQREYQYLDSSKLSNNWNIKDGYSKQSKNYSDEETYPIRGLENAGDPDIDIILSENVTERDGLCNVLSKGFKIYVHHPTDYPQASLYYYAAIANQVSSLALKFSMIHTSESLLGYPAKKRQCYFPGEKVLKYFKIYTENNCRIECQSDFVYNECNCVWFHMPHNSSTEICTNKKRTCYKTAMNKLAKAELRKKSKDACHCLPACDSIQYDAEILKTDFDIKSYDKGLIDSNITSSSILIEGFSYARVVMYFKEARFIAMRRSELFGMTDFIANCGGLLGLFLGFSCLSLVEIFYFVTLRLCCTLKRDLKKEKREKKGDKQSKSS